MDTETHSDDEYISAPSSDEPVFTSYGNSMFAGSQHFTIAGGIFNNLAVPAVPAGFRMLPMGDIDLQRELIVNTESGVVGSRRERNCVRRVYSAKVIGKKSNFSVAIYQGDGAEEDWRRDTEMYMSVRHPNIIQTWAAASYGGVHATVFHDDLVPLRPFMARQSPIMMMYLHACYAGDWKRVEDHFQSLGTPLQQWECTLSIRSSTGRLSVDPVASDIRAEFFWMAHPQVPTPSDPSNVTEVIAIESLGPRDYHLMCFVLLAQLASFSPSTAVNIGAVIFSPSHHEYEEVFIWPSHHEYEECVEIALLAEINVHPEGWRSIRTPEFAQNGWSRYPADDVSNTPFFLDVELFYAEASNWLSQANYIFSCLQIVSDLEDYKLLQHIYFTLRIGDAGRDPPAGFLFLCPPEDFRTEHTSFRWPNRPAYWSLDPEGLEALSPEEAERLGFPPFEFATNVLGRFWDASVYAGLRKFHQAKGFDPDSQEVALHLGDPLFRLSRDLNSPFAHVHDWFDEQGIYEDHKDEDSTSTNDDTYEEDGECSSCDLDWTESSTEGNDGRVVCAQPREVHQEQMGHNSSGMDQETHTDSQIANERTTGGDFIRHFFSRLQEGLVIEADNVDTDPISPFLI